MDNTMFKMIRDLQEQVKQLQAENTALSNIASNQSRTLLWIGNPYEAAKQDLINMGINEPTINMVRICINATLFNRGRADLQAMINEYLNETKTA